MKDMNIVLNIGIDEDGYVNVEKCGLGEFNWLECMLRDVVIEGMKDKDDVLEEVRMWVEEVKSNYNEEEYVKELDDKLKVFESALNGIEGDYVIVLGVRWDVEYDDNYGVIIKKFDN